MLSADVNSNTRLHSISLFNIQIAFIMGFLKSCSEPPTFQTIGGPLDPGPVGPLVNASLISIVGLVMSREFEP